MINSRIQFKELLKLSLRTFKTKPQRAFLTIAGMSIGIATVLVLVSLGYGLQYILIGKLMTTQDSLITMEISYPSESNIAIKPELIDALRKYEDVAEVSPVAEFDGEINMDSASSLLVKTRIVDNSYFRLTGLVPSMGKIVDSGSGAVISSQALVAQGLTVDESSLNKLLNLKVFYQNEGSEVSQESDSNSQIPLTGVIVDDSMEPTVIVSASELATQPPFFSKALVKAKNVDVIEALRDRLLGDGFLVSARIDLVTQARKITNIITIVLGVFGVTALVVSAIGMFNTMLVGFLERIYEVGILKSLGATDLDVRNLFLMEAAIMGFLGGAGGVLVGFLSGKLLNFLISLIATRFGGSAIQLFITPGWFVLVIMVFSILIGFISGWVPAHRAAGLSPKEAFTRK